VKAASSGTLMESSEKKNNPILLRVIVGKGRERKNKGRGKDATLRAGNGSGELVLEQNSFLSKQDGRRQTSRTSTANSEVKEIQKSPPQQTYIYKQLEERERESGLLTYECFHRLSGVDGREQESPFLKMQS